MTTENTFENAFSIIIDVRDYECDLGGGVNNAVYFNYLEHARHELLKSKGLSFKYFAEKKIGLVIIRCDIDYKRPMYSGEQVRVEVVPSRISKLRFQFEQRILNSKNEVVCLATFLGTSVGPNDRPIYLPEFELLY